LPACVPIPQPMQTGTLGARGAWAYCDRMTPSCSWCSSAAGDLTVRQPKSPWIHPHDFTKTQSLISVVCCPRCRYTPIGYIQVARRPSYCLLRGEEGPESTQDTLCIPAPWRSVQSLHGLRATHRDSDAYLTQMWPGWPTRVVVALVRELHSSAGTSPPEWLIEPAAPPAA
jgi:hypothetical protein